VSALDPLAHLCDIAGQSHSLTKLGLSDKSIGFAGASAIAEAIKQSRSMTEVDLSDNSIGDAGAVALAEAIKTKQIHGSCVAERKFTQQP